MNKYTFVIDAMISMHVDVEANTLEEAIAKAQEAPMQGLCHQCSKGEQGEWSTSGEFDTDPINSRLSEVLVNDDNLDSRSKLFKGAKKAWGGPP